MVIKLKNLLFQGLLGIGVLVSSRGLAAQELLVPPASNPTAAPQLALPGGSGSRGSESRGSGLRESLPARELPAEPSISSGSESLVPQAEPLPTGELDSGLTLFGAELDARVFDCQPALLESTGTWLRRGFWYSEVDVLLLDRVWRRDDFVLGLQVNATTPGGAPALGNELIVEGGRTGAEAAPRLNVGRFLFRDHKNRDHAMEFVAFGGGQWSQSGRLDATAGGTLLTGDFNLAVGDLSGAVGFRRPIDQGNLSFDGATAMQYEYNNRLNNFELNYHVKSRMLKDRMELEPSGHWVRRAQPSISRSLIAGIRYLDLSENFDWDAFGIDQDANPATAPETGTYRVETDNDLIGTQIGFSWGYETARWSLGLTNKTGIYLNHTDVNSEFEITGTNGASGSNDSTVDNLSFVVEGSLLAKWHLLPNTSLRAGMELLYVSSVAHAAEQPDFIPVSNGSTSIINGDSTYMGGILGFERYW